MTLARCRIDANSRRKGPVRIKALLDRGVVRRELGVGDDMARAGVGGASKDAKWRLPKPKLTAAARTSAKCAANSSSVLDRVQKEPPHVTARQSALKLRGSEEGASQGLFLLWGELIDCRCTLEPVGGVQGVQSVHIKTGPFQLPPRLPSDLSCPTRTCQPPSQAAMSASSPHYSFVPDPHTAQYLAMDARTNDRSPSPARKFWAVQQVALLEPKTPSNSCTSTRASTRRGRAGRPTTRRP
ncbi:hypothetical protein L1887_49678 [Cichorium endivia]|nr:hypothetical protein L1887_49678 [Cichorium endivia]